MDKDTLPTPVVQGDFAAGERTVPVTSEEALHGGDFAAGETTEPLTT